MLKLQLMIVGVALLVCGEVLAAVSGQVTNLNGAPVPQAMVTSTKASGAEGATATTVFANEKGEFAFPPGTPQGALTARALNYRQVTEIPAGKDATTILLRPVADQSGVAPASAYLKSVTNAADREALVMACVACHQLPAPEVRDYANLLDDTPETQSESAREEAWTAIVKHMNYVTAREFGRSGNGPSVYGGENISYGEDPAVKGKLLARTLRGPLREVRGYQYGAPLIVTPKTTIREFEVPAPNAIREAVPFDGTKHLYVADVSENRLMRIDTESGAVKDFVIPGTPRFPHTLVPASDGVWVGPFDPGSLMRFDPRNEQWKIWPLKQVGKMPVGLHDISFDPDHRLSADRRGRIWYSDILNNAVGWLDPKTGKSGEFKIPPVPGRMGDEQVYGLTMSPDRVHVWYCQLGIGSCGSFNTETHKFDTRFQFDSRNSGPRRISVSEDGMLYVPLYGAGQLAVYDTNARRMVDVFDLPDRASAPYATTWDSVRKVVWIAASNNDAIYRFDPQSRGFGILPMPRERSFLRILHVDRKSGMLVTSYANIVQQVRGPRMALLIDPGDSASDTAAGVADRAAAGEGAR